LTDRTTARNPTDDELIEQAKHVQSQAYAPYSKFKVGAAILSHDGRAFYGCNVENASYGATICAERNAVANGISNGARLFKKLAIVADREDPIMPCGICRQVLFEFSPDLVIISVGKSGRKKQVKLKDLLPFGFRLDNPK